MENKKNKRSLAYDAIYGSDIFNQLPEKNNKILIKNKQINDDNNLNYNHKHLLNDIEHPESSKQMKRVMSSTNYFTNKEINKCDNRYNYNKNKANKSNYEKYLNEFYNKNNGNNDNKLNNINNTRGLITKELENNQPFKFTKQTNRIESLKSNIFNEPDKEIFNKSYNKNYQIINKNNWNTKLDWNCQKCELQLNNNNNNINSNINKEKEENNNIVNHKYFINYNKNVDDKELRKNIIDNGLHLYNVNIKPDFYNGNNEGKISFNIRENNYNDYTNKFNNNAMHDIRNKIHQSEQCKINYNPKNYYRKNNDKNEFLVVNNYPRHNNLNKI